MNLSRSLMFFYRLILPYIGFLKSIQDFHKNGYFYCAYKDLTKIWFDYGFQTQNSWLFLNVLPPLSERLVTSEGGYVTSESSKRAYDVTSLATSFYKKYHTFFPLFIQWTTSFIIYVNIFSRFRQLFPLHWFFRSFIKTGYFYFKYRELTHIWFDYGL